jgi:hypothetical protein
VSLRAAIEHLARGDWQKAHDIVHGDESPLACWAHAVVHLQEGDVDNARYWFGRAGRRFSTSAAAELEALGRAVGPEPD